MSAGGTAYRSDIDGLRAVAILSVVLFHASSRLLPGGFIGVDIFFIISGYLITGIIIRDIDNNTFSFADFYIRRCRRILPALTLVLLSSLLLGWFILLPDEFKILGKSTVASGLFYQNILLWQDADYFDSSNQLKPLLHLWSLSVEEQFYLLWPASVILIRKLRLKLIPFMLGVLTLSFLLNVILVKGHGVATFYLLPTRFWELLLGGALAAVELHRERRLDQQSQNMKTVRSIASVLGLGVILIAFFIINAESPYPGWWALLPTLATVLVIWAGPDALLNKYFLSNRLAVFIGLISYPLYLWHWPLLAFGRIIESVQFSHPGRAVTGAFVLSILTYYLIEKPIRNRTRRVTKTIIVPALVGVLGVSITLGAVIQNNDGFAERFPAGFRQVLNYSYDPAIPYRYHKCFIGIDDDVKEFNPECIDAKFGTPDQISLLLWGDSHAAHLYPGLGKLQESHSNLRLAQFNRSACPPLLTGQSPECTKNNAIVAQVVRERKPDIVVLAARWTESLNTSTFSWLEKTIAFLKESGVKKIVVIGPVPRWHKSLLRDLYKHMVLYHSQTIPQRLEVDPHNPVKLFDEAFKTYVLQQKVDYVSAYGILCNNQGCLTVIGDHQEDLVSYDYGHLTTAASEYLIQSIAPVILDQPATDH